MSYIQEHLLAFDASNAFTIKRRPPFIPYLQGQQALFDIQFDKGSCVFSQKVVKKTSPDFFRSFVDDIMRFIDVLGGRL